MMDACDRSVIDAKYRMTRQGLHHPYTLISSIWGCDADVPSSEDLWSHRLGEQDKTRYWVPKSAMPIYRRMHHQDLNVIVRPGLAW